MKQRDGVYKMEVTVRELGPADAAELLAMQHRLDEESAFMLLEPGERKRTVAQVETMISEFRDSPNSLLTGADTAIHSAENK